MTTDGERMSVMETEIKAHFKSDDERYARIDNGLNKIDNTISNFIKMDQSLQRVYTVMDERTNTLQDDLSNVESIARAEAKASIAFAQDAHDKIAAIDQKQESKISGLKIWILTNAVVASAGILGVLAEHFIFGGKR